MMQMEEHKVKPMGRVAAVISCIAVLLAFSLCAVIQNNGIFKALPLLLLVFFLLSNFLLGRIPWVRKSQIRKRLLQVLCICIAIVISIFA